MQHWERTRRTALLVIQQFTKALQADCPLQGTDEAVPGRHPGAGGCPGASPWEGEALSGPDEVTAARRLRSPPGREPSHKHSRGQTRIPVPGPPDLSRSPAPARPGVRTPRSPRRAPGSPALTRSPSARGKKRPPRWQRQFR